MNFYIHIPFCHQKCPYCKFALTPIFDATKKRRYLHHLQQEIRDYFDTNPACDIRTIYFGGGTPSILTENELCDILKCFPNYELTFHTHKNRTEGEVGKNIPYEFMDLEISFECNPEDITSEYIHGLLHHNINRISIGVQSLNEETLHAINRSNKNTIFNALRVVESCMKNHPCTLSINIDFILGLPHSKPGETLENIREIHEKYPYITHTSVYMLEAGEYPESWQTLSIDELEIEKEYSAICNYFESIGWNQYEISNWAKPGYECKHNQGYWKHTNYRGFGLSATSYEDRIRSENSSSFSGYYQRKKTTEILDERQIQLEKVIFDTRTFSLESSIFSEKLKQKLEKSGMITIENHKIMLTPAGIFRENTIIAELIDELPP